VKLVLEVLNQGTGIQKALKTLDSHSLLIACRDKFRGNGKGHFSKVSKSLSGIQILVLSCSLS